MLNKQINTDMYYRDTCNQHNQLDTSKDYMGTHETNMKLEISKLS